MFELKSHPAVNNCQKHQSRFTSAGCIALLTNMRITSVKGELKASATIPRAGMSSGGTKSDRTPVKPRIIGNANLNNGTPAITSGSKVR